MPDETDTLTTSQSATHVITNGIGEGKSNSGTCSQSAVQGDGNTLVNSATGSHSTLVSYPEPLGIFQSQTAFHSLKPDRKEIPVLVVEPEGVVALTQVQSDSETDHYFVNDDPMVVLEVVSVDAGVQTVTIETSYTQEELSLEDRIVSIPAGGTKYIGSFPFHLYNQGIIHVYVNPSSNSLRFRAFKVR